MLPNETHRDSTNGISLAAGLSLLIGLWFFVSPWVYGSYHNPNSWNSWIVGAVMAIVAGIAMSSRSAANISWVNVVLAVWAFFSPWIYGYTGNTGRFINSLCVGVVMFVLNIAIATMASHRLSTTNATTLPHQL